MKESPILFTTNTIKPILNGKKTVTRRIVKTHKCFKEWGCTVDDAYAVQKDNNGEFWFLVAGDMGYAGPVKCRYGKAGDRLWVKETFKDYPQGGGCWYRADMPIHIKAKDTEFDEDVDMVDSDFKWTPSIYMPREASRINLEVVSVTVEKLQDITEESAKAEGVMQIGVCYGKKTLPSTASCRERYHALFDEINGDGAWDKNPWVYVIEFKRVK